MVVDRAETVVASKTVILTDAVTKEVLQIEAIVSTDNTITISNLTTINGVALLLRSDGSAVTATKATNVITITQAALTDVAIIGLVIGV